jgi:hypothetical protein
MAVKKGPRKAGTTKKSKSPKKLRKGVFARDRSTPFRRQQHGYQETVVTNDEGVTTTSRVPNYAYVKSVTTKTALRAAFEEAGHGRTLDNGFGIGRAPGWWRYHEGEHA